MCFSGVVFLRLNMAEQTFTREHVGHVSENGVGQTIDKKFEKTDSLHI